MLSLLSHSLWSNKGGLRVARGGGPDMAATNSLGGGEEPHVLPWTVWGDQSKYDRSALSQPCLQHISCMWVCAMDGGQSNRVQ